MRFFTAVGVSVAVIPFVVTSPTDFDTNSIKRIAQNVKGEDKDKLIKAPSSLSSSTVKFLQRYQHYSDDASKVVPGQDRITYSSEGQCYFEYPCFSVNNAEKAEIKSSDGKSVPEITEDQMSKLLDEIVKHSETHLDDSNPNSPWGGLKHVEQDATLEIIGPKGTVPSNQAAGMVFDAYKLQAGDSSTNAVRAVIAQPDNGPKAKIAFCLYPKGVDRDSAKHFCTGKELDGSKPNAKPAARSVDIIPRDLGDKWEKFKQTLPSIGGGESPKAAPRSIQSEGVSEDSLYSRMTHDIWDDHLEVRDPKGGSGGGKSAGDKAKDAANHASNVASIGNAGVGLDNLACKFGNIPVVCPPARRSLDEGESTERLDARARPSKPGPIREPVSFPTTLPGSAIDGQNGPFALIDPRNAEILGRDPKGGASGSKGDKAGKVADVAGTGASIVNAGLGADNLACKFGDIPFICPRSFESLEHRQSLEARSPKGGSGAGGGGKSGSRAADKAKEVGNQAGNAAGVVNTAVGADNLACQFGHIPGICPRTVEIPHEHFAALAARDPKGGSGGGTGDKAKEVGNQAGNVAGVVSGVVGVDNLACKFGHIPVICPRNIEIDHDDLAEIVSRSSREVEGSEGAWDADQLLCRNVDVPIVC